MWNTLLGEGKIGQRLLTDWIAKENLRNLLTLARTGADRHRVGHARWKFLTWCADSDIAEVRQLATAVDRWWPEIEAFIHTGHSNAKSEGINRVIKLVAQHVRVPQRGQPAATDTLRHYPPSPRTPPHRSALKTRNCHPDDSTERSVRPAMTEGAHPRGERSARFPHPERQRLP
jgi:hypothetical protein